ncbi:MAG: ORF6N domain-containing protein [Planctomycetota bacterium]
MPKRSRKKDARISKPELDLLPPERIERCIFEIRGRRVMIDADLAEFYGVPTKVLNQAVRRNVDRFPEDFRFQLSRAEFLELVTNCDRFAQLKHSTVLPHAFTEHGALMAANVLKSERAAQVSVLIIRAFVRLRQILLDHKDLARRIAEIERELAQIASRSVAHEAHIARINRLLDDLMNPPDPPKKSRIGFISDTTAAATVHPRRAGARKTADQNTATRDKAKSTR